MQFPTISWTTPKDDNKLYGLKVESVADLENLKGYYALDLSFARINQEIKGYLSSFDYEKFSQIRYVKNPGLSFPCSELQIDWAEFENTEFSGASAKNIKVDNCHTCPPIRVDCESLVIHNCIPADVEVVRDENVNLVNRFTIWCAEKKYHINYFKSNWYRLKIAGNPKMKYYEGLLMRDGYNGQAKTENYKNIESVKLHGPNYNLEFTKNMELGEPNCAFSGYTPLVLMSVIQNKIDQALKLQEEKFESKSANFESKISDLESKIIDLEVKNTNLEFKISPLPVQSYEFENIFHKINEDELKSVISKLRRVLISDRQLMAIDIREYILRK